MYASALHCFTTYHLCVSVSSSHPLSSSSLFPFSPHISISNLFFLKERFAVTLHTLFTYGGFPKGFHVDDAASYLQSKICSPYSISSLLKPSLFNCFSPKPVSSFSNFFSLFTILFKAETTAHRCLVDVERVLAATQTPTETRKKWFEGTVDVVRQFTRVFEECREYTDFVSSLQNGLYALCSASSGQQC